MCCHEVLHIHCEACNKDLYPEKTFTKDVFCEAANWAQRRSVGTCPFFSGTRHVYEKAPKDDCFACVKKKYEKKGS